MVSCVSPSLLKNDVSNVASISSVRQQEEIGRDVPRRNPFNRLTNMVK